MRFILSFLLCIILTGQSFAAETRGLRDHPEGSAAVIVPKADGPKPEPAIAARVVELIKQLSDPSWQLREEATQKLVEIGAPARKALGEATKSKDAEVAARAKRALEKIPWATSPLDSPEVAEILSNYQTFDHEDRAAAVGRLMQLGRFKAMHALLRLADWEPDEDLANGISEIVQRYSFGSSSEYVRQYTFENERTCTLALRGWAWRLHQPKSAAVLMEKVLTLWGESAKAGTLKEEEKEKALETLGWLIGIGMGDRAPLWMPPFGKLFEGDSRWLYLRAKIVLGKGHGEEAHALVAQALAAKTETPETMNRHWVAASFLKEQKWHDWEEGEWRAALAQPNALPMIQFSAHLGLGALDREVEKFDDAAEHFFAAGEMAEDNAVGMGEERAQAVQAEGQWDRARALMIQGDTKKQEEALKEMLRLSPGHPDGAGELARMYALQGRTDEAEKVLEKAKEDMGTKFEGGMTDDVTEHNNLSWLYVVANLHVKEALEEASQATALAPFEVAYLDTLAEAYFRNGQKAKALEREHFALSLEPDNDYLKRQIKRFETKEKDDRVPLQR